MKENCPQTQMSKTTVTTTNHNHYTLIFDMAKNVTQIDFVSVILFFFLKSFWRTHVIFWGHWYPCFEFLVGFKARVGSALFTFLLRQMLCTFPEFYFSLNFAKDFRKHIQYTNLKERSSEIQNILIECQSSYGGNRRKLYLPDSFFCPSVPSVPSMWPSQAEGT